MEEKQISLSIINTLSFLQLIKFVPTTSELFDFLIPSDPKVPIHKANFDVVLRNLLISNQVFYYENHYFLVDQVKNSEIGRLIERKQLLDQKRLEIIRSGKNDLKLLKKISCIKFVAIEQDLVHNNKLFIIVKKDTLYITKIVIENILKIKKLDKKYIIGVILEEDSLNLDELHKNNFINTVNAAFNLINLNVPFKDDKEYNLVHSKLMQSNMWVFEYFPNFPFQKLNLKFKSSSKKVVDTTNSYIKKINDSVYKKAKKQNLKLEKNRYIAF